MVNLIITLISIALIALIAVATLYNGGDAFREGSAQAAAAQLTNAGQQISAANILYANSNGGTFATDVADLTANGKYLSSVPRTPEGTTLSTDITGNVITVTGMGAETCVAVNEQAGAADPENVADTSSMAFGCVIDTATDPANPAVGDFTFN